MLPRPKNDKMAIGTFVFVMALDALIFSRGKFGGFSAVLWFAVNFPGFLFITFLAMICRFAESQTGGLVLAAITCLFSAAFWSFVFGYVLPFKKTA